MAIRNHTVARPEGDDSVLLLEWTGLLVGDTGSPVQFNKYADRCTQITGTFGVGGSVSMEGSNDGVNWFPVNKMAGGAATFTAAGGGQLLDNPLFMRPNVTAGDGTTNTKVTLVARTGTSINRK